MPVTRVWNDHVIEHVEKFDDREIRIKPGKYIDMEWDEAIRFRGQYRPIETDGSGVQLPESMKVIRLEQIEPLFDGQHGAKKVDDMSKFVCQACGMACVDEDHLAGHVRAQHAKDLVADKRGPGRPPKVS